MIVQLTEDQSFCAMVVFLENYYRQTGSECIGALLASLMSLEEKEPLDPQIWEEWLVCVQKVLAE